MPTFKFKVTSITTTDKLNVRNLQVNKCTLMPNEGQKSLPREAMMSVNHVAVLSSAAVGDVFDAEGTIVRETFQSDEGPKTMQWFVPA